MCNNGFVRSKLVSCEDFKVVIFSVIFDRDCSKMMFRLFTFISFASHLVV